MPRLFFPVSEESRILNITGEKAHYLLNVLRCKQGDTVEVLDGKGKSFECVIRGVSKKAITAEVIATRPCDTESPLDLILFQGILKGEKMELIIQKTTELGVKGIIPVITLRSQVRGTGKVERWRKIAEDASRQSGRTVIPAIHEPVEYRDLLKKSGDTGLKGFIFWEGGGIPLREAISEVSPSLHPTFPIHLLVGPEGGFTPEEVRMAEDRGLIAVSLGRRILRAETAAIVSTALIQFMLGDIS